MYNELTFVEDQYVEDPDFVEDEREVFYQIRLVKLYEQKEEK